MLIKDIPGYEWIYAITEEGRVFSYPKPKIHNGKWIKSAGGFLWGDKEL